MALDWMEVLLFTYGFTYTGVCGHELVVNICADLETIRNYD